MMQPAGPYIAEPTGDPVLRPEMFRLKWRDIAIILIPFGVYIALSYPLWTWLIDDAGITFAYARSLATGHGLVAQPGAPPVEGYSNFLWLLLMVPFMWFEHFDPYLTSKSLSYAFVLGTFFFAHRIVLRLTLGSRIASLLALLLIACNTSFVVWTVSGLENPLFAFLIAALTVLLLRYIERDHVSGWYPLAAALLVFCAALTRPDGIVYAAAFPLAIILRPFSMVGELIGRKIGHFIQYFFYIAVTCGGFLMFRQWYFSDWLPNTYYAKGGPEERFLVPALTLQGDYLAKARDLMASLVGQRWWLLVLLTFIIGLATVLSRRIRVRPLFLVTTLAFIGYYVHLIMPNDWMGEFRFATPFFLLFFAVLASVTFLWINNITSMRRSLNTLMFLAGVALLAMAAVEHQPRLEAFYRSPVVDFKGVAEEYSMRFDRYAGVLGIADASVLLPDVGATLWYSHLRVYDLGRLTDKVIARTLYRDQEKFYDYVFDEIKPTFIHVHGSWTNRAAFDNDPRFREQYVAIREWPDQWVEEFNGRALASGDYIRCDALSGKEHLLSSLQ